MRLYRHINTFSNVSPGATAFIECPLGFSYDAIHVKYTNLTLAQMQNIEVRIDGKPIQTFLDAAQLQEINKYYKRNIKSGVITLHFARPELDNASLRRLTSIGTADIRTLDVRIKIDPGATNPGLEAWAAQSNQAPLGMITKVKQYPGSAATSGIKQIDNIPREGRIAALHMFKSDISKVEVEVNSQKFNEFGKTLGAGVQTDHGRNPNTSIMTSVDFTLEGDPSQALVVDRNQGVQDFRLYTTIDSPGAFETVVEYLTDISGI